MSINAHGRIIMLFIQIFCLLLTVAWSAYPKLYQSMHLNLLKGMHFAKIFEELEQQLKYEDAGLTVSFAGSDDSSLVDH